MDNNFFEYAKDCEYLLDNGIVCDLFTPNSCAFFHTKIWRIDMDHRCRYYKQDTKKIKINAPAPIEKVVDPLPKSTIHLLFGE